MQNESLHTVGRLPQSASSAGAHCENTIYLRTIEFGAVFVFLVEKFGSLSQFCPFCGGELPIAAGRPEQDVAWNQFFLATNL